MKRGLGGALIVSGAVAAIVLAVAAMGADPAWARAGSGGSYGGGSSGGSSGGGSAGEIIYLIFMLIRLCFEMPIVGIPLKIVLAIVAFFYFREGGDKVVQQRRGRVINNARKAQHKNRTSAALAAIKRRDDQFDVSRLQSRTASAFKQIQKAWSAQDISPARPYVSDGIYERFTIQIQEQKDLGYRNVVEDVRIESIGVALATASEFFDEIAFRIGASATDYRIDLKTGKEIRGTRRAEHFVEYWSLIRRKDAKTPEKGLFEGNCPNCGAAIELNQSERCHSCQSVLRSGTYDWVLAEITQASEWPSPDSTKAPGVAEYRRIDPGFNFQHIEDRASVIFWRKAMVDRTAKIDALPKVALPTFYQEYQSKLPDPKERRTYIGDLAVGAVETLGVIPASKPGEGFDRVLVAMHWSGRTFTVQPGKNPIEGHDQRIRRDMFILARKSGVKTNIDHAISSAHCGNCGAPESFLAAHECENCGTVLGDGAHDWVLEDVHDLSSWQAQGRIKDAIEAAKAAASTGKPALDPDAVAAGLVAGQQMAAPKGQSRLPGSGPASGASMPPPLPATASGAGSPPPLPDEVAGSAPPPIPGAAGSPPPLPVEAFDEDPTDLRHVADPVGGGLLIWTIQMALIDERLDDKERDRIRETARAHDFSDEQVSELMEAASEGRLSTPEPSSLKEGRRWMAEMIDMALIDGSLGRDEHKLLIQAGDQFGFGPGEIDELIRDRRKALYAVAKQVTAGGDRAVVRRH